MTERLHHALLLVLALSLPFEIIHPVLPLLGLEFTNLELIALAGIGVWVARSFVGAVRARDDRGDRSSEPRRRPEVLRRPIVWAPIFLLCVGTASALLAPTHRVEALKYTARMGVGVAVFWMLADSVRSGAFRRRFLWALVAGAGVSSFVGLGEAFGWSWTAPALPLFKEAPTLVGGSLRVGASFSYATMAAAYFEVAAVVALALVVAARTWSARLFALAVAILAAANVALTLTRAGMVTLAVLLVLVISGAWWRVEVRPVALPAMVTLLALVGTTTTLAWSTEGFRTRLVTENDLEWYDARYTVPDSLRMDSGQATEVPIGVRNTGAIRWHTERRNAFRLGTYWLTDDERPVGGGHTEVELPAAVAPGDSIRMSVRLIPQLPPGDYLLVWGMLQHRILWFRHRGVPEATTAVRIDAAEGGVPPPPVETASDVPGGQMSALPPTVERLDLWEAALRMGADRPLLGMGPGNFRHTYGRYLGLEAWDETIHGNNLYLELLAGWGVAGLLAFGAVVFMIARRWLRFWRRATGQDAMDALVLGAGLLAFFIHGMLDYFLAFTGHYLLFWMLAALIVSGPETTTPGDPVDPARGDPAPRLRTSSPAV